MVDNPRVALEPWMSNQKYWLETSNVQISQNGESKSRLPYVANKKNRYDATKATLIIAILAIEINNRRLENNLPKSLTASRMIPAGSVFNAIQQLKSGKIKPSSYGAINSMGQIFPSDSQPNDIIISSVSLIVAHTKHGGKRFLTTKESENINIQTVVTLNGEPCGLEKIEKIHAEMLDAAYDKPIASSFRSDSIISQYSDKEVIPPIHNEHVHIVGRNWIFDEIESLFRIGRQSSSPVKNGGDYLCIVAPPGFGKTTICIGYSKLKNTPAVLIKRGSTTIESLLNQLFLQLSNRFPTTQLPSPNKSDQYGESYLANLFKATNLTLIAEDRFIEIIFDALDEAPPEILDILPRHLPDRISVLTTYRGSNSKSSPLSSKVENLRIIAIHPNDERNKQDVDLYLAEAEKTPQIKLYAQTNNKKISTIIKTLRDRSEFNFMYLHYVLNDLCYKSQIYESLDDLPQGLEEYYNLHFKIIRQKSLAAKDWESVRFPIITVLSSSARAQPIRGLQILASRNLKQPIDLLKIEQFLDEIDQFLIEEQEKIPNLKKNISTYRIYHSDFRDYLNHRADFNDVSEIQNFIRKRMSEIQLRRHTK